MAEVALAWTLARKGVGSTLVGANKVSQLESNIAALDLYLDEAQLKRVNNVSAPLFECTSGLSFPLIRRIVFGGHDVLSWAD
jgi:diketogulonate reductase-like aldo/keto reductase